MTNNHRTFPFGGLLLEERLGGEAPDHVTYRRATFDAARYFHYFMQFMPDSLTSLQARTAALSCSSSIDPACGQVRR